MPLASAQPKSVEESAEPDRTLSILRANVIGGLVLPPAALLTLVPYGFIWGTDSLLAGFDSATWPLWRFLLWLSAAVLAHELLHVAGFLLGGARRADVRIGVHLRMLTPYARCSAPLEIGSYRLAVALPGLVLGIVPAVVAWLYGSGWLAVAAFIMVATAGGDVLILWLTRDLPRGVLVLDHPGRVGCAVVTEAHPTGGLRQAGRAELPRWTGAANTREG